MRCPSKMNNSRKMPERRRYLFRADIKSMYIYELPPVEQKTQILDSINFSLTRANIAWKHASLPHPPQSLVRPAVVNLYNLIFYRY